MFLDPILLVSWHDMLFKMARLKLSTMTFDCECKGVVLILLKNWHKYLNKSEIKFVA